MVLAENRIDMDTCRFRGERIQSRPKAEPRRKFKIPVKALVGLAGIVIINLVFQSLVIQRDYEIRMVQTKIGEQQLAINRARVAIAGLEAPERIELLAKNKFGMRQAEERDYRFVAAAPPSSGEMSSHYALEHHDNSNVWEKVASWLGGFHRTMAKTP